MQQPKLCFQFLATVAAYYVMIQDLSAGDISCGSMAIVRSVAPGNGTNVTMAT